MTDTPLTLAEARDAVNRLPAWYAGGYVKRVEVLAILARLAPSNPEGLRCVDCGGDHPSGHPWHTPPAATPAPLDVDALGDAIVASFRRLGAQPGVHKGDGWPAYMESPTGRDAVMLIVTSVARDLAREYTAILARRESRPPEGEA